MKSIATMDSSVRISRRIHEEKQQTPVFISTVFPTSPMSDLRSHNAKNALRAAFSNRSSLVKRLKVANSRMRDPAPAVPKVTLIPIKAVVQIYGQVSVVSPSITPLRRLTFENVSLSATKSRKI